MENKDIQKDIDALTQIKNALDAEIIQKNATIAQLDSEVTNRTATRDSLNNEITTQTTARDILKTEISTLTNSKIEIDNHIAANTPNKQTLDTEINQRNATITQLDTDIASRTSTRDSLNTQITTLTNSKTEIDNYISNSTPVKITLDQDISGLNTTKINLNDDIKKLQTDKQKLEDNVKQWREKNDLFSNDISGISEDSSAQRTKYALGIGLSFLAAIIFMWILISSVKDGIDLPEGIKKDLAGNPRLLFSVFLLMRISIVGTLFVLIFIFINLTRGFVSQFIRTQEKMTAVRLIDYLVSKIGKESSSLTDEEKVQFETIKLDKQKEILNKHLPELIEYNPSSFDKLSKTNSPDEIITELIKTGKLVLPKNPE